MPLGTVNFRLLFLLFLGTYLFPLARFFLVFATQYFADIDSTF